MKATKIKIKNMFGIKEIELDEKSRELIGANGTGKTSIIDAIKYALTNKSARDYVIRNGESEGEVLIETDSGISINRKARLGKADYKSIKENNKQVQMAETFLREIFTELQLNPIEFLSMSKDEQNRIILDMIDFKWDLNWIKDQFGEIVPGVNYEQNILNVLFEIQSEDGYYFKKRQDLNREARNKQAFIVEIGSNLPEEYNAEKWEKATLSDIYTKIEEIRTKNAVIEKAREVVAAKDDKIVVLNSKRAKLLSNVDEEYSRTKKEILDKVQRLKEEIKEAEGYIKQVDTELKAKKEVIHQEWQIKLDNVVAETQKHESLAGEEIQPVNDLQEEAAHVEKMKGFINEYKRLVGLSQEVEELKAESISLTDKIERARQLPGKILKESNVPIEGLSIKDGIPLINGLPINNLSSGEQMELCVAVAGRQNGTLNIVLLDGVEKLTTDNRSKLYAELKKKDIQFIATRTTENSELTVVEL